MDTRRKRPVSIPDNGHRSVVITLSRAEIVESLNAAARRRTGMSARALLRRYRRGTLQNPSAVADLVALSNLLRKNDPILAE